MNWRLGLLSTVLCACAGVASGQQAVETFGCEANPTGNPIGGGEGYEPIFTRGDFTVSTADEFLAALGKARPGQVVFVPHGAEIDLTGKKDIRIPAGVTLAGTRGLDGSPGARVFTTWSESHRLMRTGGERVRVTGLRFEGACASTEKVASHSHFLLVDHYACEVDNCEVYNFNISGIGVGLGAMKARIHHNFIHHCQRSGYGYGVYVSSSNARVIANRFDYCRHHIACGGQPGAGYEAAWNFVGPHAIGHHFDVHGGRDRGDSTNIAGDWIHVHHNTFQGTARHLVIRGVPSQWGKVHHNWFALPKAKAVISTDNTQVYRNVYGPNRTIEE